MVEIKLETGKNVTDIGRLIIYFIIGISVVSVVLAVVALYYFMVVNPLGT